MVCGLSDVGFIFGGYPLGFLVPSFLVSGFWFRVLELFWGYLGIGLVSSGFMFCLFEVCLVDFMF